MKLVLNSTVEIEIARKPKTDGNTICFPLVDATLVPEELSGEVVVKNTIVWPTAGVLEVTDENGKKTEVEQSTNEPEDFILYTTNVSDWLRSYIVGNTLYFTNEPEIGAVEPPTTSIEELLERAKATKITESKVKLAEFLSANPLLFTDGKYYSVTEEKQQLLASQLTLYSIAQEAGYEYELKWNSTGDVCVPWTVEALTTLAVSIGMHVQPLVSYQQTKEVEIKNCTTIDEVAAVEIDYSTVRLITGEESPDEDSPSE